MYSKYIQDITNTNRYQLVRSGFWQFACKCAQSSHQLSPDLGKVVMYVPSIVSHIPWRCLKPVEGSRVVFRMHRTLAAQRCSCMGDPVKRKKVYLGSDSVLMIRKCTFKNHCLCFGGKDVHLCDVPIVSGAPCKSPKTENLSGSSRLVTFSSPTENCLKILKKCGKSSRLVMFSSPAKNCLAHLVCQRRQGNSPLMLFLLRNIPG